MRMDGNGDVITHHRRDLQPYPPNIIMGVIIAYTDKAVLDSFSESSGSSSFNLRRIISAFPHLRMLAEILITWI